MPTYQYVCTQCETPLEAVQSFSDSALTECPTCGGTLRKVFSAVGVVFKGSGFYKNDSRPGKKKADASSSSSSESGGSSETSSSKDGAAKSDSAPAVKTEKKSESKPAAATPSKTPASSSS